MADFNTDESLVGDSGNDNPKIKKVKALPITTALPTEGFQPRQKGVKDDSFQLETPKNEFSSEELGITADDFDNYGNIYKGQDINKMRAEYQSNWDRLGNLGVRVASNIVGGTISSMGSVPAVAEGITDELKGKDADFSNSVMELGDSIKQWAKENYPNYRENPNETWDVTDPAFWFDGVESAFSTLEFMAGSYGAVKGLGAVSKLLKAERALAKVGLNAKSINFGAKVATGAGFSRNAENMMESMQLVKDTKETLLKDWEDNPEKFEELKNSEVAKEVNGELTPENLAKHIAGKAGWEAYQVNSINIVFDALQFAPLVKGFNPSTRLGNMATSSAIKAENKALSGVVNAASPSAKVFDYLNPFVSSIGRSASEGIEEAINYMGTLKGKNLVNKITGQQEEDVDLGEISESAFWGMFGGMAYEGVSKLANRKESNIDTENRIGEIKNRMNILNEASKAITEISNNPTLPNEIKKDHINAVKAELSLDLGLRAAQAGNIDLLLEQVESKEFADKLVEIGLTEPGEAEKAIAKTKSDIILAEQLYKDYYNSFQFVEGSQRAKNELMNKSIVADYFVRKNIEKRNQTAQELEDLKANDVYVSNNPSSNINTLIELEGLFAARRELNKVVRKTSKGEELLSHRGKVEIENINNRILAIKDQVKDERLNKEEINPRIIAKQAEIILMDSQNRLQKQHIKDNTKPDAVIKQEEVIKEREKKAVEKNETDMLSTAKEIIEADTDLTITKLTEYLNAYKDYPLVLKYINQKIKDISVKEEIKTKQDNVQKEQEPLKPVENVVNPVKETVSSEFGGLGNFTIETVDESTVDPMYKTDIDNAILNKDYSVLEGYVSDSFYNAGNIYKPVAQYARAKFEEHKAAIKAAKESQELNSELPKAEHNGLEFDEFAEHEAILSSKTTLDSLEKQEIKDEPDTDEEVFTFLSKDISKEVCTGTIPMFRGFGATGEGHQEYYQTKGGNIVVQDKYVNTVETLMNPEFGEGSEVEIIYDEKETKPEHKDSLENAAFAIVYKGTTVGYIGRVENIDITIKKLIEKGNRKKANEIALDLIKIKKLRKKLHLDGKPFKTKIVTKGNGTIISAGTRPTALRSIKGISEKLYALNSNSYRDRTTLVNLENEEDRISNENPLIPGKVYMGLSNANGQIIPVPLSVAKVNKAQAKEIVNNTKNLLDALNRGKKIENQEVKDIRDQISKYIKVDKAADFDKPIGYRVYPQSIKEDGKTRDARIVVAYKNLKGEHKTAVIKKSIYTGEMWMGLYNTNEKKSHYEITSSDDNFDKALTDLFTLKYHNIDFAKLNSKKSAAFEYNNKIYKNYKEYLIEEEIIKTDVAQVVDKNGKVISNLFGFNSDFKLTVEVDPIKTEKESLFTNINDIIEEISTGFKDDYEIYKNKTSNTSQLLKEITNKPKSNNIKRVADWLLSNSHKFTNLDVELGALKKDNRLGYYAHPSKEVTKIEENSFTVKKNNPKIFIDETLTEIEFQEVFLHEMLHAVTIAGIMKSMNYKVLDSSSKIDITDVKFKEGTSKNTQKFIENILSVRNEVIDGLTNKYGKTVEELASEIDPFYGLQDTFEFISEIMTKPSFRREISRLGKRDLIDRIWNAIIDFLREFFGMEMYIPENDLLKKATSVIRDFVDNATVNELSALNNSSTSFYYESKMVDEFNGNFNRDSIKDIIDTFKGLISNVIIKGKIDTGEEFKDRNKDSIRENIRRILRQHVDKSTEEMKKTVEKIAYDYFDKFYDKAISQINKNFKIGTAFDINLLKENEGLTKDWDDTKAQQISSQDSVTKQIKMFVMTIPELDNLDHTFDSEKNPLWNRKNSTVTGIPKYVDFNVVYPYMIRNLIGARSRGEIIERLETMAQIHPSFSYMSYELQKDENLIAQFESNLSRKTIYDSYVTFISNIEDNREVWITDELKSTRYDVTIGNEWNVAVDATIDKIHSTEGGLLDFKIAMDNLFSKITKASKVFNEDRTQVIDPILQYAHTMGIDISYATIQNAVNSSRDFFDLKDRLIDTLDLISESIEKKRKTDDKKRLLTLAKLEAVYRFDVVENSGLDIQGNLLYAIRNPSYISNWMNDLKSLSLEGDKTSKEEVERLLIGMTKVPEMQFSAWLWNNKAKEGLINFEIINGIRVPKKLKNGNLDINLSFIDKFNFHDFGGAKEVLSKESQKYSEFGDNDWKLMNLFSYLYLKDKSSESERTRDRDFVLIPSIIASDSGKAGLFEVPKIKLNKKDIYRTNGIIKIKQDSDLFKAVLNVAKGEVRRIQQVTNQLFDIVDNKITIKKDIKIDHLQQYYHYKKLVRNEDGTVNIEKTLLDENGNPTGKSMYFNNMSVKEGNKTISLDDVPGVKTNGYIVTGEIDATTRNNIIKFVDTFIQQKVEQGLKEYSSLEDEVKGKHDNVVDGSYQGLIVEYILNHYIHNHEQFLFFNGTIAEYKDKIDTNKRAKQLFTPGVALSLEAMKIVYQNGSQGDGQTFRAITIADINTTSNTIDFIIDTVKKTLIKERGYSKENIKDFSLDKVKSKKAENSNNALIKDTYRIIKGYLDINAGDAQGYITLDRYEALKRGRGEYNDTIKSVVEKARKGETLTFKESMSLQPVKGFHYQREYDAINNKMTSTQIKYSTIPLIPAMVKGTELEKLMNYMNDKAVDEVFFESAHKVGAKMIYKIDNADGTINESILKNAKPNVYLNRDYKIQLDTPEHLLDEENLLAVQISKLIIANLDSKTTYNIGDKNFSSKELIERYFKIWSSNIEESAYNLLKELNIEIEEDIIGNKNYIVVDEKIKSILEKEVEKRGLSDNYTYAIELNKDGKFKLPLFINNMSTKWEAILTSLFTNRITKQKIGGGSAVLASRLFLDSSKKQSDVTTGIKWSKEKNEDKTLKSFYIDNGKTQVVEVLMGGWSKYLYKDNQLVDIDEVPDEIKTMIGYRIPTTSKSYMTVFKVVGFLPEESKGIIVTPDDMITQMGQDFDIDKWFLINKEFVRTRKGKFTVAKYESKEEFEALQEDVKELTTLLETSTSSEIKELTEGADKLLGDIFTGQETDDDLRKELNDKRELLKQFGKYNEDGSFTYNPKSESKAARNNEMFEIYKTILTNPVHYKEILTPSGYPNITDITNEVDRIFNTNDKNIEPLTEFGQRTFRKRNIVGKNLLGISANFNGFMAVAQVTKMNLNDNIAFKQKVVFNEQYDLKRLKTQYGKNIEISEDKTSGIITLTGLGYAPDGSYFNVDGELIMEVSAEPVNAAADNAKDPRLEKLNLSTYTYPTFHAGTGSGVSPKFMGFFMKQPVLELLNKYYFDNKSILSDETGKQIETIKRFYQTTLLKSLITSDPNYSNKRLNIISDKIKILESQKADKSEKEIKDINDKIKKLNNKYDKANKAFTDYAKKEKFRQESGVGIGFDSRYLLFMSRDVTDIVLDYDPNELTVFSIEDLQKQLELKANGKTSGNVEYLKTQLEVLEWFNRWKKAGEGLSDMAKVAKTDGLGAGPTMDITSELIRTIESLENNERILIEGKPAVTKLYPSHFGLEGESFYPPLESYFELSNKLSRDVLSKLFITQTQPFRDVVYTIAGKIKGSERRTLGEEEVKHINKFLNVTILKGFKDFAGLKGSQVLGVSKEPIIIPEMMTLQQLEEMGLEKFQSLSTAEKIAIMKLVYKDRLQLESQHILNFVSPVFENEDTQKKKGYHEIAFKFYKNEFTDDNLADSIASMYDSGNIFERDMAESLIHYSFIANGLTYGLRSYSKVIPSEVLYKMGIGEELYKKQELLQKGISGFDGETIDLFFRNNWGNSDFIPVVLTRWDYIKDSSGKKVIRRDENGNPFTKNKTPIWDSTQSIIRTGKKQLAAMDNSKVMLAPYISLWTKEGLKLYKKYTETYIDELGLQKEVETFNGDYYFYQVNRLGKDGIFEFEKTSMFSDNNVEKSEAELTHEIQNTIANIKKQSNAPKTENTSQEKKDEIINKCNISSK